MIEGFEFQTSKLTSEEVKIMNMILPHLSSKKGESMAVTNSTMCKGILKTYGLKITGPRMRKIVNHIRINAMIPCLVATSKGYYVETDKVKLTKYIKGLESRSEAIKKVANCLKAQRDQMLFHFE